MSKSMSLKAQTSLAILLGLGLTWLTARAAETGYLPGDDKAKTDAEAFIGRWRLVTTKLKRTISQAKEGHMFEYTNNTPLRPIPGEPMRKNFWKCHPTRTPGTIDLFIKENKDEPTLRGIYKFAD